MGHDISYRKLISSISRGRLNRTQRKPMRLELLSQKEYYIKVGIKEVIQGARRSEFADREGNQLGQPVKATPNLGCDVLLH